MARDKRRAFMTESRPPLPPFTEQTAAQKVRMAEDAWNSREPARVALAYTPDSRWRNRAEFINGRAEIEAFLRRKWAKELDYRLIKELWTCAGNRIAVRFAYEHHDDNGALLPGGSAVAWGNAWEQGRRCSQSHWRSLDQTQSGLSRSPALPHVDPMRDAATRQRFDFGPQILMIQR